MTDTIDQAIHWDDPIQRRGMGATCVDCTILSEELEVAAEEVQRLSEGEPAPGADASPQVVRAWHDYVNARRAYHAELQHGG